MCILCMWKKGLLLVIWQQSFESVVVTTQWIFFNIFQFLKANTYEINVNWINLANWNNAMFVYLSFCINKRYKNKYNEVTTPLARPIRKDRKTIMATNFKHGLARCA